jgi:membrane associated rhomboid family serine protease
VFPLKDNIPTLRFPAVTVALIAANVLMYFLFQKGGLTLGDTATDAYQCNLGEYAAVPRELTDSAFSLGACQGDTEPSRWVTPFTSMFMHGGLLHLGGNMLFLWIFGNNVEDSMGPVRYLAFYVLGGLAALALQVAVGPNSEVPTVGASGAIAGVLGAYLLLFPRARVLTAIFLIFFFTLIEIPAVLVLGFWFVQQAVFGYLDLSAPGGEAGGVAYFAHIGGFVFGLLAIKLFVDRKREENRRWLGG